MEYQYIVKPKTNRKPKFWDMLEYGNIYIYIADAYGDAPPSPCLFWAFA